MLKDGDFNAPEVLPELVETRDDEGIPTGERPAADLDVDGRAEELFAGIADRTNAGAAE